ncbi:MAG: peptidoglycan-binding protein [Defluviicoccus sp.]|nr:MAG: peptidoglycan-binding protein [Defluviicoccus sp.]
MRALGYDVGASDEATGDHTREAIMRFQRDHGLAPTGQVSPALLTDLRRVAVRNVNNHQAADSALSPAEQPARPAPEPSTSPLTPAPPPATTDGDTAPLGRLPRQSQPE